MKYLLLLVLGSVSCSLGVKFCKERGTWIHGSHSWKGGMKNLSACQKKCNNDASCSAYTYGSKTCWIYGHSAVDYVSSAGHMKSGFKQGASPRCPGSNTVDVTTPKTTKEPTGSPTVKPTENPTVKPTVNPVTKPTGGCSMKTEPTYDYNEVLEKSLLFYEAQRSGELPADNRVDWREDSALNDGQPEGYDLSGGYYDAGDYVKFGFPMAASITVLAWGMIDYESAYKCADQMEHGYAAVKWGTDYFIKAHVSDNKFYGQCGDGHVDHAYWGRPEDMTMNRPCWAIDSSCPGSDLAGETAAALASAAILFKTKDPTYSNECLNHAEMLYNFAKTYKGKYHECITNAKDFYKSWGGYWDELAWAAAWLYKTTGDDQYLNDADDFMSYHNGLDTPAEFSWDEKFAGAQVILYKETKDSKYITGTTKFCKNVVNPNTSPVHSPKGLPFFAKWGSLRYAANAAFICLQVSELGIDVQDNRCNAVNTMGYILGDTGRSFVVGYGTNPPQRPHHGSSSCPWPSDGTCDWSTFNSPEPNAHVLVGALVGGPDNNYDYYEDKRDNYIMNEVTTDYNAGFTSLLAGLSQLHSNEDVQC